MFVVEIRINDGTNLMVGYRWLGRTGHLGMAGPFSCCWTLHDGSHEILRTSPLYIKEKIMPGQ